MEVELFKGEVFERFKLIVKRARQKVKMGAIGLNLDQLRIGNQVCVSILIKK